MHQMHSLLHNTMRNHICSVQKHTETSEYVLRNLPWHKRIISNFHSSIRITTKNPRSHLYYRTNTAILQEREKHIKSDFTHIIHPFSIFRMYWEMFMLYVFCNYLVIAPVIVAFFHSDPNDNSEINLSFVEGIFDFFCISDIVMTFFTGYTIEQTKQVILNPRYISGHYVLSGFFIMDTLSSMPTELAIYIIKSYEKLAKHWEFVKFINLLALLKVIRVKTLLVYMGRVAELWHINLILLNTIKYFFISFLLLHWCGCLQFIVPCYWYGTHNLPNNSWITKRGFTNSSSIFDKYIECLFKASTQLFGVANRVYSAETCDDIIMDILVGFIGYVVAAVALVMFLQFLFRIHTSEIKYYSILNQLKQYMRHKQLPLAMQKRLIDYYEYRFCGSYFRENTIFPTISDRLRKDMTIYVCMNLVKKVPILKDLPPSVNAHIVPSLRQEVFLPNDIIVKAGTTGDCMYFIHCGTVAVYTPTGKEICHLQDGGYFGEMGLIAKDCKRIANVVAIETTEVYRLDRKYFNSYMRTLPDLYKKLERIADRRRENTLVMEEIHRKHILEKTMRMMDDR